MDADDRTVLIHSRSPVTWVLDPEVLAAPPSGGPVPAVIVLGTTVQTAFLVFCQQDSLTQTPGNRPTSPPPAAGSRDGKSSREIPRHASHSPDSPGLRDCV